MPFPRFARPRMTPEEATALVHAGVPLAAHWAIEVLEISDGAALLRLPAAPLLLRPGETVSGPALMGLADVAFWAAVLGAYGGDAGFTLNLAITFLDRAGPGPILAEAKLVRRGRRIVYGEVLLRAEDSSKPCAHVTTSWAMR